VTWIHYDRMCQPRHSTGVTGTQSSTRKNAPAHVGSCHHAPTCMWFDDEQEAIEVHATPVRCHRTYWLLSQHALQRCELSAAFSVSHRWHQWLIPYTTFNLQQSSQLLTNFVVASSVISDNPTDLAELTRLAGARAALWNDVVLNWLSTRTLM